MENELWCDCEGEDREKCFAGASYRNDGECECGIHKHHYHGLICRKIVQIG